MGGVSGSESREAGSTAWSRSSLASLATVPPLMFPLRGSPTPMRPAAPVSSASTALAEAGPSYKTTLTYDGKAGATTVVMPKYLSGWEQTGFFTLQAGVAAEMKPGLVGLQLDDRTVVTLSQPDLSTFSCVGGSGGPWDSKTGPIGWAVCNCELSKTLPLKVFSNKSWRVEQTFSASGTKLVGDNRCGMSGNVWALTIRHA